MNSLDCENGVIGSLLISPETLATIKEIISPEDFVSDVARCAYLSALVLERAGKPVDPMLIAEQMSDTYTSDDINRYLAGCMEVTPTAANVESYCRIVKDASSGRKLREIGQRLFFENSDWLGAARQATEELEQLISGNIQHDLLNGADMAESFSTYRERLERDKDKLICSTGFTDFDKLLGGGLYAGGFYLIGARPGMGKTTMAIAIAENVLKRGKTVLFVSLEMSDYQITAKRLARAQHLSYTRLMSESQLSAAEQNRLGAGLKQLGDTSLYLNRRFGLTVDDIAALAKRIKHLDLVVVDYFGLIRPTGRSFGRYEDMTQISGQLKQLALSLDVPLVTLSQLSRANSSREDKRPQLSDLRDTGALEQDADAVVFLHRDAYYKRDVGAANADDEELEILVAKNRHGYTGSIKMFWDGESGTVEQIGTIPAQSVKTPVILPF